MAEQVCPKCGLGCIACYDVGYQNAMARQRAKLLKEASDKGYLDHRDDCRKGIDSKTCTCGIMKWLAQ